MDSVPGLFNRHRGSRPPNRLPNRAFERTVLWIRILRRVRADPRLEIGLVASATLDILLHTLIGKDLDSSPHSYVSGILWLSVEGEDVKYYIRSCADDIYNCMPAREHDVEAEILSHLGEGDVFVDVGANIGYYSVLGAKRVGRLGRVVAVEPLPANGQVLEKNVRLNSLSNVTVVNAACWSLSSRITLSWPPGDYGRASAVSRRGFGRATVETVTLDFVCSELPAIKFLKIDAEGAEAEILQGGRRSLMKTKYIILELSERKEEIVKLLQGSGFAVKPLLFPPYVMAVNEKLP